MTPGGLAKAKTREVAAGLYGHLTSSEVQQTVRRLWAIEPKQHAPQAAKANLSSDSSRGSCSPLGGKAR